MVEAWLPSWVDNSRIGTGAAPDQPFDEFLNVPNELQEALYAALADDLAAGRLRRATNTAEASYKRVLGCVAANAIVAMEKGPRTFVHYSRGKGTYAGKSVYYPEWMSSKLLRASIDKLAEAGWLSVETADAGPFGGQGRPRSTYEATPQLQTRLRELGITVEGVERDHKAAPVVLVRGESGKLQNYDPRADAIAPKIEFLMRWNEWISQQDLGLKLPDDMKAPNPVPDLNARRLMRWFSNSFEEHGRFYGGWWQNLKKEQRPHITISEEPTVELDFQGLAPRLLYHLEGMEFDGDPYEIPEIRSAGEAEGIAWEDLRPVVKKVFNYMLNARKRGGYNRSDAFKGWPSEISAQWAIEAIERFHAPIKHRFFKREALRLMNFDSQICEEVMRAGLEQNIPVLPIHDSFIVAERHEVWLIEQMRRAYLLVVGYVPVIR